MNRTPNYQNLFPEDFPSQLKPFDPGGGGAWFAYVSNRNQATCLFAPRPLDELMRALNKALPVGYATLFLLEKVLVHRPGEPTPALPPAGFAYGVFLGPEQAHVGSSAMLCESVSLEEADAAAAEYCRMQQMPAMVVRIVEILPWY
ncbi:MAG: hypothetical protein CVV27_00150 [Candidatus Melainabacteria bacterium HGW-Melainabacteria-1]|nr:MAG: hypothetical protein CVV27_00150 [Candidatus Melainabacteria bacterium HGW-Melainabacteria-1]